MKKTRALLMLALSLVLLGGGLASWVQTSGGKTQIQDVRFTGADGQQLSALLYIPHGVDSKHPAPGVLAVHGYINSRETQDAFSIEFARRGYVVLDLDQAGHGFSAPPAFANGFGGPAALSYLRSLDIVDKNNIGLEGHSMGGWTVLAAAAAMPNDYKALVLEGSSPGLPLAATGTPTWPRNLLDVYGSWEEFSPLMYGVNNPKDADASSKMKALFGTDQTVVENRLYGSIANGTARKLVRPSSTHPGLTADPYAVSAATGWFAQTLTGGHTASGQTWWLKEIGTLIAFIGGVLFLFPFGRALLGTRYFAPLRGTVAQPRGIKPGPLWVVSALVATVLPTLTFFYFQDQAISLVHLSPWFPQQITTGIVGWAFGNGLVSLALLAVWHFRRNRGARLADYGISRAGSGKAIVLAVSVTGALYFLLAFSDWAFMTDFRFWVLQLHLMDALHLRIFLVYLLPMAFFFTVLGAVLHTQLRGTERSLRRELLLNAAIVDLGMVVFLFVDYLPLITGGRLAWPDQPLLAIVAFQVVVLLAIVPMISTYFHRLTGSVLPGAFICAVLVAWNTVAGTATQQPVNAWDGGTVFVRVGLPVLAALVLLVGVVRHLRRSGAEDPAEVSV